MGTKYITDDKNNKWFNVHEKLPEGIFQYEYVLTYSCLLQEYDILYYLRDENEWHNGMGRTYEFHEITHWRPLPEEPPFFYCHPEDLENE